MKTKFTNFISDFHYIAGQKTWCSATYLLNEWLKENPTIEVVNWQVCATGTTAACTIVLEFYDREGTESGS